jgi:hypothetical protein
MRYDIMKIIKENNMAMRSLHTCYTIDREPLTQEELDELARKLGEFMKGFESKNNPPHE